MKMEYVPAIIKHENVATSYKEHVRCPVCNEVKCDVKLGNSLVYTCSYCHSIATMLIEIDEDCLKLRWARDILVLDKMKELFQKEEKIASKGEERKALTTKRTKGILGYITK